MVSEKIKNMLESNDPEMVRLGFTLLDPKEVNEEDFKLIINVLQKSNLDIEMRREMVVITSKIYNILYFQRKLEKNKR